MNTRVLWLTKGLGRGGAERLLASCARHVSPAYAVEVAYVLPWKDALVPELTAAGVPVHHVVLERPFRLSGAGIPEDADLVVIGNPTNPTSVLHRREELLKLRRPGRILVVDEAFADAVPGEPESLAGDPLPDVLVLRSLTKTWALAGLRVGYALGSPEVLARLTAQRAHWPVGTLQLEAIAACCGPRASRPGDAGRWSCSRTPTGAPSRPPTRCSRRSRSPRRARSGCCARRRRRNS